MWNMANRTARHKQRYYYRVVRVVEEVEPANYKETNLLLEATIALHAPTGFGSVACPSKLYDWVITCQRSRAFP